MLREGNARAAEFGWKIFLAIISIVFLGVLLPKKAEGVFTNAYLRPDRLIASTATNVLVVMKPASAGTEAKVKVTFPATWTVGASPTVNTSNLPSGVIAVPGSLSASGAGQVVTITGVTDMSTSSTYGVNIATGVTTGNAGTSTGTITTTTSGDVTIDATDVGLDLISNDQISVTATVAPTFTLSFNNNSQALGTLSSSSTVSATATNVTFTTNSNSGWIAWIKDLNAGLQSTILGAPKKIPTTSVGSVTDLASNTGYGVAAAIVTDSATSGTGTVSVDAGYDNAGSSTKVGGLSSTAFQIFASANGPTDGDVISLTTRAKITAIQQAASDYVDTLTVVAAGNF